MSNAGPSESLLTNEQWQSLQTRCTNLVLGFGSIEPESVGTILKNMEWNDLTIKVYGSDANDLISDGGGWNTFNPQGLGD